jgi:hypothetical protein
MEDIHNIEQSISKEIEEQVAEYLLSLRKEVRSELAKMIKELRKEGVLSRKEIKAKVAEAKPIMAQEMIKATEAYVEQLSLQIKSDAASKLNLGKFRERVAPTGLPTYSYKSRLKTKSNMMPSTLPVEDLVSSSTTGEVPLLSSPAAKDEMEKGKLRGKESTEDIVEGKRNTQRIIKLLEEIVKNTSDGGNSPYTPSKKNDKDDENKDDGIWGAIKTFLKNSPIGLYVRTLMALGGALLSVVKALLHPLETFKNMLGGMKSVLNKITGGKLFGDVAETARGQHPSVPSGKGKIPSAADYKKAPNKLNPGRTAPSMPIESSPAATTAKTGVLSKLGRFTGGALGVAAAAYAGWEIGSALSDEFLTNEDGSNKIADVMMQGKNKEIAQDQAKYDEADKLRVVMKQNAAKGTPPTAKQKQDYLNLGGGEKYIKDMEQLAEKNAAPTSAKVTARKNTEKAKAALIEAQKSNDPEKIKAATTAYTEAVKNENTVSSVSSTSNVANSNSSALNESYDNTVSSVSATPKTTSTDVDSTVVATPAETSKLGDRMDFLTKAQDELDAVTQSQEAKKLGDIINAPNNTTNLVNNTIDKTVKMFSTRNQESTFNRFMDNRLSYT